MLYRKIGLTAITCVLVAGTQVSFAQVSGNTGGGPPQDMRSGSDDRGRMLWQQLNLSDAQKRQIRSIMQATRPQMQALRDRMKADETSNSISAITADHEQERGLHQQTEERIKAILTPEQRATYQSLRATHRDHGGGGGPDGRDGPSGPGGQE